LNLKVDGGDVGTRKWMICCSAEKMMQFSAPIIIINPVSRKNLNSSIRFFWDKLGLFKYISKSFKSPLFNTKCLPKSQSISYPTQSVHGASSENAALKKQSHYTKNLTRKPPSKQPGTPSILTQQSNRQKTKQLDMNVNSEKLASHK